MNMIMSKIGLLMVVLLLSFSVFAQEEHHQRKAHTHSKYAKVKNPVAMNEKSIAVGGKLYDKHCIACHGKAGIGGIGPDLTRSVRIHGNTDGEIFHIITDGVAGTKMKGLERNWMMR